MITPFFRSLFCLSAAFLAAHGFAARAPAFQLAGGDQGKRDEAVMEQLYQHPFPSTGGWHFIGHALASYWTGKGSEGDAAIAALAADSADKKEGATEESGFHWQAFQVERIIFLFGQDGGLASGRMSPAAEVSAKTLLWNWLAPRARLTLTDPAHDWWVWGSENHHLQAWFSQWGALSLLARDPAYQARVFADGSTVPQLKKAFDEYFKRWIKNRATRGLFVECNSTTYAKYSLSGFYNFFDFADDPELRRLAGQYLDLYWTQWALEQIEGERTGSRHRSYPGPPSMVQGGGGDGLAWFHFGGPEAPRVVHPSTWCTATSSYTPPSVVGQIVSHRADLGDYQITSRQPGLADPSGVPVANFVSDPKYPFYTPQGLYQLDPFCRSILRKTYATPSFILGTTMVPALSSKAWTSISSQNRWDGVVFAGANHARIYLQSHLPPKGSLYNTQWGVQECGVAILQALSPLMADAGPEQMFFSPLLQRSEVDGWIFVEAPQAYAAVKVVDGKWTWQPDNASDWHGGKFKPGLGGEWLVPSVPLSPIVLEVAPKSAFQSAAAFRSAILRNLLTRTTNSVMYQSAQYHTTLTLFTDYARPPRIDGQPVNYETPQCFSSPFLNGKFGGSTVDLHVFGEQHRFSFQGGEE